MTKDGEYLIGHKRPPRHPVAITRDQLSPLVMQGMKSPQIATLLGFSDVYVRQLIVRYKIARPEKSFEDFFWERVDKSAGLNGCWIWKRAKDSGGYELCSTRHPKLKRQEKAHRVAFYLTHGHLPAYPLILMHPCDNPPCVNPAHLAPGTHLDNSRDCCEKGRKAAPLRGESNPCHILTAEKVLALRKFVAEGIPLSVASKQFNVPYHAAWNAVNRKTWGHLD